MAETKYPIKAMTAGEVLDVGIRVARDHFKPLLIVACFLALPYHLVLSTVEHYAHATVYVAPAENEDGAAIETPVVQSQQERDNLDTLYQTLFWIGNIVVEPLSSGMLVFLASSLYLGKPATPFAAWGILRFCWVNLIGAAFLYMLVILGGFLLIIIPGIYWAIKYCLYPPLIVLEDRTAGNFFERSAFLIKGNWFTAFAFTLIFTIAVVLTGLVIDLIPVAPVKIALTTLLSVAAAIVGAPVYVVFYYSCRCKNENFDLAYLAEQAAADDAAPPPEIAQS